MKRPYLRVTPGETSPVPGDIPDTLASLHKLTRSDSESLLHRLNPFQRQPQISFEFVALSGGDGAPVKFYYGADDHLDALEQRLRSIYPTTFDIDRVEIDLTKKLLRPVEYSREEFTERCEEGRLYHETHGSSVDGQETVSDAREVADLGDQPDIEPRTPGVEVNPEEAHLDVDLPDANLAPPSAPDKDEPMTALEKPTATEDGRILARPPLTEVEPYGVQWCATAERRKDWMTTLTGLTDVLGEMWEKVDEEPDTSRFPLIPVIEQLSQSPQPLAFQVVFQRKTDWSRAARRRTGELLDGTDTLLQKVLGFESSRRGQAFATRGQSTQSSRPTSGSSPPRRNRSLTGGRPSRTSIEPETRYELVQANSPKRTFSVNLQVLALAIDDEERERLNARLDSLCSVFDLVDGEYYELDGRRLRSHGHLPGSGERHAHATLDRFIERSVATGGKRFAITNRSETRPDLVLNGNELANFVTIPSATDFPAEEPPGDESGQTAPDESAVEEQESGEGASDRGPTPADGQSAAEEELFDNIPESVIHRDREVKQLSSALRPLARGESADTVIIAGPTGSGKTCTAKFAVDQFRQTNAAVATVYVNCWENQSPFQALYRILDTIDTTVDIHRQSTPQDVLLDRLQEYDRQPCIVIFDEVDQLDDKGVLYELLDLPQCSLLLIVNHEEELFGGIDERLESRLRGCQRIRFNQYTVDELVDILRQRIPDRFESSDFERSELEIIAKAAGGDARVAITTLRIAARNDNEGSGARITRDIVESALPEARQEVVGENLDELSPHQRTVFAIIEDFGRIAPKELYEEYRRRVDEPKSNRTIRNYLTKLERHGLVAAEGSTRDRVYRSNI